MKSQEQNNPGIPEVEPPPGLAGRTCAKNWGILDAEAGESAVHSNTFMNSAFFSPESILPPSFLLQSSESEEAKPAVAKISRFADIVDAEDEPSRTSRIGLIASISVGIIIAFLLFPIIRFVERSTRSHIAEGMTSEISRRIGQYEQIHGSLVGSSAPPVALPVTGEILPIDLALSGWQQLPSTLFAASPSLLFQAEESIISSKKSKETFVNSSDMTVWDSWNVKHPPWVVMDTFVPFIGRGIICPHEELKRYSNSIKSDNTLLVMPEQGYVRSAFGQAILFKDARVFSRVLPGGEPPKN